MTPATDPAVLWILGVLVTLLTLLVAAIYAAVVKAIDKTDATEKQHNTEITTALQNTKDDAAEIYRDLWAEINLLKDRYHGINTQHLQWCQKHEDQLKVFEHKFQSMESKLKGQGDFFNKRVEEIKVLFNKINNKFSVLTKKRTP